MSESKVKRVLGVGAAGDIDHPEVVPTVEEQNAATKKAAAEEKKAAAEERKSHRDEVASSG